MPRPSKNIHNLTEIDIPMQCFSCGNLIADKPTKWYKIKKELSEEERKDKNRNGIIMDRLGLNCIGCRSIVLSHILYQKTS